MDVGLEQVRAARAAIEAARIALDFVLDAAEYSNEPPPGSTNGCLHQEKTNAGVMAGEQRDYCSECRHFIYPDGREVPANE